MDDDGMPNGEKKPEGSLAVETDDDVEAAGDEPWEMVGRNVLPSRDEEVSWEDLFRLARSHSSAPIGKFKKERG